MARGIALGLLAAVLFGLSAPAAKLLLPSSGPFLLAGLLYLGAGGGLLAFALLRRAPVARITREDLVPLGVVIAAGGIVGPVLLMAGLARTAGVTGSLLLNLELPLTILGAVIFLREPMSRREAPGAVLVVLGAVLLAWRPGARLQADPLGVLAIAGACAAWAVDNNVSQKLSLRDPVTVVCWKALPAGAVNLGLAFALGERLPGAPLLAASLGTGFASYGLSLVCNLLAVRRLGAARQAALFGVAPFAGALASVPLLGERLGAVEGGAAALMAGGLVLMLSMKHGHRHVHEGVVHTHAHVHDEHHRHPHDGEPAEPHTHEHVHERLEHDHPHAPDAHHRHRHG